MISYGGLWKILADNQMSKTELLNKLNISSATFAKLGKNEPVNLKVIESICEILHCRIEDVVEIKVNK